jgi:hypothetical protein
MKMKLTLVAVSGCLLFNSAAPAVHAGTAPEQRFGYGGLTAPKTPVLDVVGGAGLRFRNVWAMPECSPSRAMFFKGGIRSAQIS